MKKSTHLISGALLAEAYILWLGVPTDMYYLTHPMVLSTGMTAGGICLAGSVFPDVDLRLRVFGHRTLTHWPIPYAIGAILAWFGGWSLAFLFCASVLAHIFLDSLTKMGVPIFTPFGRRYGFRLIYTGSVFEMLVVLVLCGIGWVIF